MWLQKLKTWLCRSNIAIEHCSETIWPKKSFQQFWQAKILHTLTSDNVHKICLIVTNFSENPFPTLSATSSFIKAGIALHFSVGRGKFQTRLFHQIWQISVSTGRTCRGGKPIRWGPNQTKYEAMSSFTKK